MGLHTAICARHLLSPRSSETRTSRLPIGVGTRQQSSFSEGPASWVRARRRRQDPAELKEMTYVGRQSRRASPQARFFVDSACCCCWRWQPCNRGSEPSGEREGERLLPSGPRLRRFGATRCVYLKLYTAHLCDWRVCACV